MLLVLALTAALSAASADGASWRDTLSEGFGVAASAEPGGVAVVTLPTTARVIQGTTDLPAASRLSFVRSGPADVLLMTGDLVVETPRADGVVSKLSGAGVHVAGRADLFPGATPAMTTLHVYAQGWPEEISRTVRSVLDGR